LDGGVEKIWVELQDLNPSRDSFAKEGETGSAEDFF
jgi:hypothetical protein